MTVDFNGDGHDDIAAGAINAEDDVRDIGCAGAIFLYAEMGHVSQEPVQIIHGQRLSPASEGKRQLGGRLQSNGSVFGLWPYRCRRPL